MPNPHTQKKCLKLTFLSNPTSPDQFCPLWSRSKIFDFFHPRWQDSEGGLSLAGWQDSEVRVLPSGDGNFFHPNAEKKNFFPKLTSFIKFYQFRPVRTTSDHFCEEKNHFLRLFFTPLARLGGGSESCHLYLLWICLQCNIRRRSLALKARLSPTL